MCSRYMYKYVGASGPVCCIFYNYVHVSSTMNMIIDLSQKYVVIAPMQFFWLTFFMFTYNRDVIILLDYCGMWSMLNMRLVLARKWFELVYYKYLCESQFIARHNYWKLSGFFNTCSKYEILNNSTPNASHVFSSLKCQICPTKCQQGRMWLNPIAFNTWYVKNIISCMCTIDIDISISMMCT